MALEPIRSLPESNAYYTRLSLGPYERGDAFALSTFQEKLIVHLPLPTELRDDTSVSYTNVNLETVGDAFMNRSNMTDTAVLRNTGQLAQLAMRGSSSGLSGVLDGRGGAAAVLDAAQGALLGAGQALLPPDQINSAVQQRLGAAPNPNPSVQFQGPVLRSFSFTWAFYPKNAAESARIDNLIRKLKARALPSDNSAAGSAILNYPHICRLNFFPWDGKGTADDNGWTPNSIIKIKKCFMENVNVNYHAFGTPGFFEGTQLPISYQLTISFKEIDYLLSNDWDPDGGLAASERTQGTITGDTAISLVTGEVIPALGDILVDTFRIAGDLLLETVAGADDQNAADKEDQARIALEALVPPRPRQTTPSVVFTKPGGIGFSGNYTYTISKNSEGKFVLVQTFPDQGGGGDGPRISRDPVTTEYPDEAAVRAFLNQEAVFTEGTQTQPPLQEAAAPAPAQE